MSTLRERLRPAVGAFVGIGATGLLASWTLGAVGDTPLLMAPSGASAVLLFAVPASPLAQPWPVVGGNVVSALVGVSCAFVPSLTLAAALAVSLAIGLMSLCRCLHPPGGAVALLAVVGGAKVHALGYGFVLAPVALNSLILLGCALAWHRLTGQVYPQRYVFSKAPARASAP